MATTYSMDEEKKKEDELVFGQRGFDEPRKEVTMKDFKSEPKFIKREGGGFARRGTATAQRAENKEKNRNRAKAMAKARIAAKKK